MATKTLVNVIADAAFSGAGDKVLTPSERALLLNSNTSFMAAPWLNAIESGGVANTKAGVSDVPSYAGPTVAGVFPSFVEGGGPDDAPHYKAKSSDPVGGLYTDSGIVNRTGDWTISFVGKASTNTSGGIAGIAGSNGGAFGIALRTGDLVRLQKFNSSGTVTVIGDAPATTADWHHIVVSYDISATTLKVWVDGTLGNTFVNSLGLTDSRLTMFSTYDPLSTPALALDGDNSSIAQLFVVNEYVGGTDASTLNSLTGAAAERFPSIFA
ncbi:hypothetical protein A3734_16690 [Sulfitobacter sp. HI0054]|uniref:LamG-like jellyroll fold domain-containing protein n=1 Tax=Sulfitobacter sp. HI0054 TaxID=1822238 RepID=UPI0007C3BD1E|nr:LamG-like jellyroll fold domain-containing protein [Sulfitobacter sp. HI0054]KZY53113.1 hypothetical protein A3734_16690 [Sulfitobacter sp. HI0054]